MIKILLYRLRQVKPSREVENFTAEQVPKANLENLTAYLLLKDSRSRIVTAVLAGL